MIGECLEAADEVERLFLEQRGNALLWIFAAACIAIGVWL